MFARLRGACGMMLLLAASSAAAFQNQPTPPPPPPPSSGPTAVPLRPDFSNTMPDTRTQMYTWDVTRIANNPAAASAAAESVSDCLVQRAKDKAGTMVGGPLTADPGFKQLASSLGGRYSVCAAKAQGMPLYAINASLAELLVRRDYPTGKAPLPAADSPASKAFYDSGNGNVTIDSLARCIAVHSPALVYRLVSTKAGSAEEGQALSATYAQTPACGVTIAPANVPVAEQRAAFAVAMYAWMQRAS